MPMVCSSIAPPIYWSMLILMPNPYMHKEILPNTISKTLIQWLWNSKVTPHINQDHLHPNQLEIGVNLGTNTSYNIWLKPIPKALSSNERYILDAFLKSVYSLMLMEFGAKCFHI
jgi:hypothetical protein